MENDLNTWFKVLDKIGKCYDALQDIEERITQLEKKVNDGDN